MGERLAIESRGTTGGLMRDSAGDRVCYRAMPVALFMSILAVA